MRINHNISAMNTNRQLRKSGDLLSNSLERLSSGYRINKAADDAAGLAISRKMKTQIEGLEQASRNGSDGISVIQTAEGGLSEIEAMLQRMRELSVQAANGVNTAEDRANIQAEINQLTQEIDRISNTNEFNTKKLLDGSINNNYYSSNKNINLIYLTDSVELKDYEITVTQDARQAVVTAGDVFFDEIGEDEEGTITINGYPIQVSEGETMEKVFGKIRSACDSMNIKAFFGDGPSEDGDPDFAGYEEQEIGFGTLVFMSKAYGSEQTIEIQCNSEGLSDLFGLSQGGVKVKGIDAEVELGEGFNATATSASKGDIIYVTDTDGFEMRYRITPGAAKTDFTDATADGLSESSINGSDPEATMVKILDAGPMDLQVGANEGQEMTIRIPRMDSITLGIDKANVCTDEQAQLAISIFDKAVNEVSAIRAKLGAYQNRLDHAVSNLDITSLNVTSAMSRIEDIDMAQEMTVYTQKNVLEQAGTAMLAQANQRPENILALLNG